MVGKVANPSGQITTKSKHSIIIHRPTCSRLVGIGLFVSEVMCCVPCREHNDVDTKCTLEYFATALKADES